MPGASSISRRGSAGLTSSMVVANDIASHHGIRGSVPTTIATTSALAAITAQVSSDNRKRRVKFGAGEGVDIGEDLGTSLSPI